MSHDQILHQYYSKIFPIHLIYLINYGHFKHLIYFIHHVFSYIWHI